MSETRKISEITLGFRDKLGAARGSKVTQEEFGGLLAEGLLNSGITRVTIHNWESGKGEPDLKFLLSIYTYHFWKKNDWRFQWALECLRAMQPETFDSGVIALAESNQEVRSVDV